MEPIPKADHKQLHLAAEFSNIELIEELINRGADVNDQRAFTSVLAAASSHGRYEVAKVLIDHGARVYGDALEAAQSMELIDLLRIHADDVTLSTCGALHEACRRWRQSPNYVTQMLDRGFDINSRNWMGDTPLLSSCGDSNPQPEIIELLVRNGADINARSIRAYSRDVTIGDTPCTSKQV
jgi:ankyrin repeat protein